MGKVISSVASFSNKPREWVFGKKLARKTDLFGKATGIYKEPGAAAAPIEAPSPIVDDQGLLARNRVRRIAKRAQGQQSTIRTGSTGAPYTGTPKTLLGG